MSGQPGNVNALQHGAKSERQIKANARNHRRRFMRRAGLRAHELDPIAAEYLEHVARGKAILDLREATEGQTGTETRDYWVAYNGVSRAVEKLERRLKELGLDKAKPMPGRKLEAHLAARNGNGSAV